MTRLFSYLLFDGNCREALQFYERVLQGRIEAMSTVGESPMAAQFPAHAAQRVIHARIAVAGQTLMASDWMASLPYPGIQGVRIMLAMPHMELAEQVFAALAAGGHVESALRATPFAQSYGTLKDRFGVPWQVMVES